MNPVEEIVGYQFRRPGLLSQALTHPSVSHESQKPKDDNQRLEFLGDAVLDLVLTEELFGRFPQYQEGHLTKLRARLVSRDALASFARALGLGHHLILGKGEEANGGRDRDSNLADAFEALIGALYLDGGIDPAKKFILGQASDAMAEAASQPEEGNPKGQLQERLQAISPESPNYETLSAEGADHEKTFTVRVLWNGTKLGRGTGNSKKVAETMAAQAALENERLAEIAR